MLKKYLDYISNLEKNNLRELKTYDKTYIDFSSNDYLCLSKNRQVQEAGFEAVKKYGAGTTGSRLLSGNNEIFEDFEKRISNDKNTDSALIFNSGFQANSGVLESLLDKDSIVIFDKLNHASMYFGVFASKAKLFRYDHQNYNQLEDLLKSNRNKNVLIASETVFGMDGDIADLESLFYLSKKYNTILYIDEAHATGLYGINGYGVSTNYNLDKERTIIMGTFSKAIGVSGAYIACSNLIKKYIIQKCKGFIYSTSNSPFCIGASFKSWELIPSFTNERAKIFELANYLRKRLKDMNYKVLGNNTNIIPIEIENVENMLNIKENLLCEKIIVSAIRKPTSPTPRIRVAINSSHEHESIEKIIEALK